MGRKRKYLTEEERKAAHNESCKKYRENNPEKIQESQKKHYESNSEKEKERQKKYRENNPEKEKERHKKYRKNNPEKEKEKQKKYRENNPDYYKQWREEHKEEIDEYNKQYYNTPIGRGNCLVNSYRKTDKLYDRGECTLTGKWIVDNIFTSKCHYCQKDDWTKLGCDRIFNDLPHTPDNVVCCCEECNKKRGSKPHEEFCKEMGVEPIIIKTDEVLIN